MLKQTRRKFVATLSFLTFGATAMAFPAPKNMKTKPKLAHHVFFWLKNPDSVEDRNKLIEGLKTLEKVKTVKSLHIGVPADTTKRDVIDGSYQVAELMFFDDAAGQNAYQTDPIHLKFVEGYSHLWAKVVVYDSLSV